MNWTLYTRRFSHAILINLHGQQKRYAQFKLAFGAMLTKYVLHEMELTEICQMLMHYYRRSPESVRLQSFTPFRNSWVHCKQERFQLRNVIACIFASTNKQIDRWTDRQANTNREHVLFAVCVYWKNIINSSIDVTNSFAHSQRNDVEIVDHNVS